MAAIREGLAANLRAIQGFDVSAYLKSNPNPPAIHLYPDEVTYDAAMNRGLDDLYFIVQAFVATSLDQDAQQKLDLMLAKSGATSIKAAIESDRTLGGVVSDTHVVNSDTYTTYERGDGSILLGANWRVRVLAN